MGQATSIKNTIVTHLKNLVDAQTIGNFYEADLSKDVLEGSYSNFPVALLGMSDVKTDYLDNRDNLNTYKFQIIVMQKVDNVKSPTDIEDLKDLIMTEFANDPTFGLGNGWVDPPVSPLAPVSTPDKSYIVFLIEIVAHVAQTLTF